MAASHDGSFLERGELVKANRALSETIAALQRVDDFEDFVPTVLEIVARTFDGGACGMFERIDTINYLRFWYMDGRVFRPQQLLELDPHTWGLVQLLVEGFTVPDAYVAGDDQSTRSRAVIIDHEAGTARPDFDDFTRRLGWELELNAPINVGGRAVGAMTVNRGKDRPFTRAEIELVETLSAQLGLAIEANRLSRRARERAVEVAVALERNRLAGEIHDSLAQSFTSIALQSESLSARLDAGSPIRPTLELIERTARLGLAEARRSVLDLRPIGDSPGELESALRQLAERCTIAGSIECILTTSGVHAPIPPRLRDTILRVAQEAVSNAMRHAEARHLVIELEERAGGLELVVSDDGKGLGDASVSRSRGFGLDGMRSRAIAVGGELEIGTAEGGVGTRVRLRAPLGEGGSAR